MNGQEVAVVVTTDPGIPPAAPVDGTQGIDPPEGLFQRDGVIGEVFTVSAPHCT